MTLGPAIKPKLPPEPPEWTRCIEKDRRGFWSHRDPPHRLRYDPDAWEQAAATLEDNARRGAFPTIPDPDGEEGDDGIGAVCFEPEPKPKPPEPTEPFIPDEEGY